MPVGIVLGRRLVVVDDGEWGMREGWMDGLTIWQRVG